MSKLPKPRSTLCWSCGKKLYQSRIHVEKVVEGHPRILHKQCWKDLNNQEEEETESYEDVLEDD